MNASDIGNSPSDEMGFPIRLMFVGVFGSMEKSVTVLDPGCKKGELVSPTALKVRVSMTHVDSREHFALL